MRSLSLLSYILLVFLFSCSTVVEQKNKNTAITIDLKDPLVQKVIQEAGSQEPAQIVQFLSSGNPQVKYLALSLLANQPKSSDRNIANSLITELQYPTTDRVTAVKALRTFADSTYTQNLISLFQQDSFEHKVKKEILTTVGAIGSSKYLDLISKERTYTYQDTLIIEAQAHCLYEFQKRGLSSKSSVLRMAEIGSSPKASTEARLIAIDYLLKSKKEDFFEFSNIIIHSFTNEQNPTLKARLANLIAHVGEPTGLIELKAALQSDNSLEVKKSILSSLHKYPYDLVYEVLLSHTIDTMSIGLSPIAAEVLAKKGKQKDGLKYLQLAEAHTDTLTKTYLYEAAYRFGTNKVREFTNKSIFKAYTSTINPQYKGQYLKAYTGFPYNYKFVYNQAIAKKHIKPIYADGMEGLMDILTKRPFKKFRESNVKSKNSLVYIAKENVLSGKNTPVTIVEQGLVQKDIPYNLIFGSGGFKFLNDALHSAIANKDQKAFVVIDSLMKKNEIRKDTTIKSRPRKCTPYQINWDILNNYSDEIRISTNKGSFFIKVDKTNAPFATSLFFENIQAGKYDDLYFHDELIGNLIKTGCSEGDGYSYTMENLPLENQGTSFLSRGQVAFDVDKWGFGSNQWFITTSSLPQLDHSYSSFGTIIKGYDTILKLHKGDKIDSIELTAL